MTWKKFVKLALLFLLLLNILINFNIFAKTRTTQVKYVSNKIIVKFTTRVDTDGRTIKKVESNSAIRSLMQLNTFYQLQDIQPLFPPVANRPVANAIELWQIYRLTFPASVDLEAVLTAYQNDPWVEYARLIGIHPLLETIPNDPEYYQQWALPHINAPQAWDLARGDTSVILAIIDSGVDWMHPDLGGTEPYINGNIWINWREYSGIGGVDDDGNGYVDDIRGWDWVDGVNGYPGEDCNTADNNPMDFYGHGSHVAGIAAAIGNNSEGITGLSWNCKIMALRAGYAASRFGGEVDMSFCAQAIYYAVTMGATAINCSWASSNTGGIEAALDYARDNGVLIVAAAGNEAVPESYYLSSRPEIITVAGTNSTDVKTSSSNFGYWVDVAAPGESIYSTIFGILSDSAPDNHGYKFMNGTSMATPFVTGLTGLIKSQFPHLNSEQIRTKIVNNTVKIDSQNINYAGGKLGHGRLDALMALINPDRDDHIPIFTESFDKGLPATWTADVDWRDDDPGNRNEDYDDLVETGTIQVGYDVWQPPFMIVDSDFAGPGVIDASLVTPSIDCRHFTDIRLVFDNWFQPYYSGAPEIGEIDVSINNGDWKSVALFLSYPSYGYNNVDAGRNCMVRLPVYVDNQENVRLRFHYYNANYDWFWGIDNIRLLGLPGAVGLVTGTATDATTLLPVANATIRVDTVTTHTDSAGHYSLLLPVGNYTLQASKEHYQTQAIDNIVVTRAETTLVDIAMLAAHISIKKDSIRTTLAFNDSIDYVLDLLNIGKIDLHISNITGIWDSTAISSPAMVELVYNDELPWLAVNPTTGSVSPGDTLKVNVQLKSLELQAGMYRFILEISSNDPDTPIVLLPIILHVVDYPFSHQDILLNRGWNLISWHLDTENDSIQSVFAGFLDQIAIILGFEDVGLTFDPELTQFSNLTVVDHWHGYWVKMKSNQILRIFGRPVSMETPRPLDQNWNLVSYLPEFPDSTAHVLQNIMEHLVIVMGFDREGLAYDPAFPELSTLNVMRPGSGYWLKMTGADTLRYQVSPCDGNIAGPIVTPGEADPAPVPTSKWINVFADSMVLDGVPVAIGTPVTAVTRSGIICGKSWIKKPGKLDFVPVYADDPGTEMNEGPKPGEPIQILVGDSARVEISWSQFGDVINLSDLLKTSIVAGQKQPKEFKLSQNYPNPFSRSDGTKTTLIKYQVPGPAKVRLVLTNILGQTIRVWHNDVTEPGSYHVYWDGTDATGQSVAGGVYLYHIETKDYVATGKIVVIQ